MHMHKQLITHGHIANITTVVGHEHHWTPILSASEGCPAFPCCQAAPELSQAEVAQICRLARGVSG